MDDRDGTSSAKLMKDVDKASLHKGGAQGLHRGRQFHVDFVKAVGISLVVLCHSWSLQAVLRHPLIMSALGATVPSFVATSGFLYARRPTLANLGRRLLRIVSPYFCATAIAELYTHFRPAEAENNEFMIVGSKNGFIQDVVFALALPHYYFVFVLVVLLCITPALGQASRRTLKVLLAISVLLHVACKEGLELLLGFNENWILRNPLSWLGYFLCGWMSPFWPTAPWWKSLLVLIIALHGQLVLPYPLGTLVWIYTLVTCQSMLFSPGARLPGGLQRVMVWLSTNSYTVYLYHSFFIDVAAGCLRKTSLEGIPLYLTIWALAMAGSCSLALLAMRCLGPVVGGLMFGCAEAQVEDKREELETSAEAS